MYHGRKPDISHLRVFGARAFAHVPLEMQTKLGVKSRECLFMGYPPGQKGYCVCDLETGTFFTSTAVIFDENSPYAPLHDTSPIATPLDVGEPIPELRNLNSSSAHPPDPPRRSSRSLHLTAAGKAQAARITAAKIHLEDVREAARLRTQPTKSSNTEGTIALLTHPSQLSSKPENSIFSCYLPSLELAFMSIRSSEHRNPTSHDYDLTTPPYNYNEAMCRPDRDIWQATIDKELDMFISMKIFCEELLPPGHLAIGSTWVFEFKITNPPPNVAKGHFCACRYSQIPHLDYTETFALVAKTTSVRIVAALAAKLDLHLECFDAT